MIYKLLHKLFGWDYIAWENTADNGIARVFKDENNCVYYWRYKGIKVADRILSKDQVIWLTCNPDKFLTP